MLIMRFQLYNGNKLDITQQIVVDKYVLKVFLREEYSEKELNFHDISEKENLNQLIGQSSDIYAYSKIKDCKYYKDALTESLNTLKTRKNYCISTLRLENLKKIQKQFNLISLMLITKISSINTWVECQTIKSSNPKQHF
jgi:hypothetical protein